MNEFNQTEVSLPKEKESGLYKFVCAMPTAIYAAVIGVVDKKRAPECSL